MSGGKLWGVGLGPGDPELVTVKAARIITSADVIAFHSARHGKSVSRRIAVPYMRPGQLEEHLVYPVTTEETDHPGGYHSAIEDFYTEAAHRLAKHLRQGRVVALLAAGDPLFYSSFAHMHRRLADEFETEIIPGVTSVSAASAALGKPLVHGDQVLTVLPGTLPTAELVEHLRTTDAAAILKLGRTYPQVHRALHESGRAERAAYVQRASTPEQHILPAGKVDPAEVPYFSLILIPGSEPGEQPGQCGEVTVVGLGPGDPQWTTPEATAALSQATDLVGYTTYLARVPHRLGQRRHASDNRVEAERAILALDLARRGARVAVVSSGDPGVFGMAAAVLQQASGSEWAEVPVRVLPGVTAAHAVASRVGAPLGHDYAVISLSDQLKPWEMIARRLRALAAADMAMAIYNPASRRRTWQVAAMRELLLEHRKPDTPVVLGRAVGSPEESVQVVRLADLDPAIIDMQTLLIVGASNTHWGESPHHNQVFTTRAYRI